MGLYFIQLLRVPFLLRRGKFSVNRGKNGQNLDFIWCGLVFYRDFGRPKTAKINIFLKRGCKVGAGCSSVCLTFGVSTGCRLASVRGLSSLSWCVPSLCLLSRFAFGTLCLNMALFRVLRGFDGVSLVPCGFACIHLFSF